MPAVASDTHALPSDLDVPAARAAEAHFDEAIRQGVPEGRAWAEAVDLFRLYHPAWPWPLAEREGVRIVGALMGWRQAACQRKAYPVPPLDLLRPSPIHTSGGGQGRRRNLRIIVRVCARMA